MHRRTWFKYAALFLLAFLPRVAALHCGGPPHDFVPDEHAVRAAFVMLERKDPLLLDGSPSSYPHLLPWVLVPTYGAIYAWERITGSVDSPAAFAAAAAEDPWRFFYCARLISALAGALSALAIFRLACRLGAAERAAWMSAALFATSPLSVLLSAQARPWALMVLCFVYAMERALHACMHRGEGFAAASLGTAAAIAAHPMGFVAGLPWLCAAVIAGRYRPRLALASAGGAALLVAAAYPGLWHPAAVPLTHDFEGAPLLLAGQGLFLRFDGSRAGEIALQLLTMEPVLLLAAALAVTSIALGALHSAPRATRRAMLGTGLLITSLALFFLLYFGTLLRYALPMLALLAAWSAPRHRWQSAVLAFALMASCATCIRLAWVLARPDTRVFAAQFVGLLSRGERLAYEPGALAFPLDSASLERLFAIDPECLSRRELLRWSERTPGGCAAFPLDRIYATRALEDWLPRYAADWAKTLRASPQDAAERWRVFVQREGILGVVTARRFSGDGSALLDRDLDAHAEVIWQIAPGSDDARLPGEPARGWFTLWSADLPGPALVYYRY